MSETKNYHLFTEDNPKANFHDTRKQLYGSENSNMTKIDEILAEKADSSKPITAVLSAAKWSENSPYVQTLEVEELTANQNGVIGMAQGLTIEQKEAVCYGELIVDSQAEGKVIIKAYGDKPSVDIPVAIILLD